MSDRLADELKKIWSAYGQPGTMEDFVSDTLALIQEVSKSAKPEKKQYYRCFNPECVSTMPVEKQAFNEAIDQYEQNIKELLGGSSE